jgi:hypothetical protein
VVVGDVVLWRRWWIGVRLMLHMIERRLLPLFLPVKDVCDRTTSKMRGFVSQDHIGGFSTKRECANIHK